MYRVTRNFAAAAAATVLFAGVAPMAAVAAERPADAKNVRLEG